MYTKSIHKMDIYDNIVLCKNCNRETIKSEIIRNGFNIRTWVCPRCKQIWEHPGDLQRYRNFEKLKNKNFHVKLRLVGNSYTVSIPREIIEFHRRANEIEKEMDKIIDICLEEPFKLSLFFSKIRKSFINREDLK